jgi:hypothetical protein
MCVEIPGKSVLAIGIASRRRGRRQCDHRRRPLSCPFPGPEYPSAIGGVRFKRLEKTQALFDGDFSGSPGPVSTRRHFSYAGYFYGHRQGALGEGYVAGMIPGRKSYAGIERSLASR